MQVSRGTTVRFAHSPRPLPFPFGFRQEDNGEPYREPTKKMVIKNYSHPSGGGGRSPPGPPAPTA